MEIKLRRNAIIYKQNKSVLQKYGEINMEKEINKTIILYFFLFMTQSAVKPSLTILKKLPHSTNCKKKEKKEKGFTTVPWRKVKYERMMKDRLK